jgi:hypothetical protein
MFFVLQSANMKSMYLCRREEDNSFQLTKDLYEALLFHAVMKDGQLKSKPEIPPGEWIPRAVSLRL